MLSAKFLLAVNFLPVQILHNPVSCRLASEQALPMNSNPHRSLSPSDLPPAPHRLIQTSNCKCLQQNREIFLEFKTSLTRDLLSC